jgi:exodeoxyribonuclease V alpha subunit
VVSRSLPNRGFDPSDIQVLSPMQKGVAGAVNLNEQLQNALNPKNEELSEASRSGRVYRQGDRVIQLRNNYDKSVFNGDIGLVESIDNEEERLTVKFTDQTIDYNFSELDELSLAYALSIHKSQGSEFPAVVIAMHTQHFALLQRQIVYTALTRAKKMAVIVGSKKAIAIAVRNDHQSKRLTLLKERIQGVA